MELLWFTFAGEHSLQDHGLRILAWPVVPTPQRRLQAIHIPGKSSSIWYDDGTLDDFSIRVACGLTLPPGASAADTMSHFDAVKAWLYSVPEGPLTFSFQPEKVHQARVNGPLEFEVRMRRLGRFEIPFLCRPLVGEGE